MTAMTRRDLTPRQLQELDRIILNPGRVTATKHFCRFEEAEWLVSRGLARWVVRAGMQTSMLTGTPKGARVADAF